MKIEQTGNENSPAINKQKVSQVLYRIHSKHRVATNTLLEIIHQNFTSSEFFSEYKKLKDIPVWNQMREITFQIIEKEFLQTIIEKGLKKDIHKLMIQNNYDDYIRFFQRKIRYLITDLEHDMRFDEYLIKFNDEIMSEILMNLELDKEKMLDTKHLSGFISKVNDQISLSFVNFFSRKIAVFLTSKEPYRKIILDYFAEFFHYLVVF